MVVLTKAGHTKNNGQVLYTATNQTLWISPKRASHSLTFGSISGLQECVWVAWNPEENQRPGRSLREKQVFQNGSVAKDLVLYSYVQPWLVAIGGWLLVAVGGSSRRLVVGDWWLVVVGSGWRLAVGRRWRLAVGGW